MISCPLASIIAFITVALTTVAMAAILRLGQYPKQGSFFSDWKDSLEAFRSARGGEEKVFVLALVFAQVLRATGWGVVAATVAAGFPAAAAICWDLSPLSIVARLLDRLFEYLLDPSPRS